MLRFVLNIVLRNLQIQNLYTHTKRCGSQCSLHSSLLFHPSPIHSNEYCDFSTNFFFKLHFPEIRYVRNIIVNNVRQHNYFITQGNYIG